MPKTDLIQAADTVQYFINRFGCRIGNTEESIGDGIQDAMNWLGEKFHIKIPFILVGGVIKGVFPVLAVVFTGLLGIFAGITGGAIKLIYGIFTRRAFLGGVSDLISPIAGTIILVLGTVMALLQSVCYAQGFERPLTNKERTQLQKVFKNSINYYVLRIVEGHAGIFGINSRPFVLGNTIYMKKCRDFGVLVHEAVHIWQFQHTGNRYASDALRAQWFSPDPYNWKREIITKGKITWVDFNAEAQAEFIHILWKAEYFEITNRKPCLFVDGIDLSDFAKETVEKMRSGR